MPTTLIRRRSLITHATSRHVWNEIAGGAVLQRDGLIQEVGAFASLSARHPDVPVIGGGDDILLPGFVNGQNCCRT